MRATILHFFLGIALCIPVLDTIAQENRAMTTSCSVENTHWRPGNTFTVSARRLTDETWSYKNQELTDEFKQVASQTVHDTGTNEYDYKFENDDGAELNCKVQIRRKGHGSQTHLKFTSADCEGDQPYECKKNYNNGNQVFRIFYTVDE